MRARARVKLRIEKNRWLISSQSDHFVYLRINTRPVTNIIALGKQAFSSLLRFKKILVIVYVLSVSKLENDLAQTAHFNGEPQTQD